MPINISHIIVLLVLCGTMTTAYGAPAAGVPVLRAPGISVSAQAWDDVRIQDASGQTLMTLTGFQVKPAMLDARSGSVKQITIAGGAAAIEVSYGLADSQGPSSAKLTALIAARPNCVDVRYELTGLPAGAKADTSLFGRRLADHAVELPVTKYGLWQRHAHGGQPVEIPDGRLRSYRVADRLVSLMFEVGTDATLDWKDPWSHHLPLVVADSRPGVFSGGFSVVLTPTDCSAEMISARFHGRPLSLRLQTGKTYNWWTDASSPLTFQAMLFNTSTEDRAVEAKYWVRDFAGKVLTEQTREIILKAGQTLAKPIRFTPADQRGIYFAEFSVTDRTTGSEVFARTNLALLPPHVFKGSSQESIMGIAAYFPIPTEADARRLMERMGVRWLREGKSPPYENMAVLHHCHIPDKSYEEDPAEGDKWIRTHLQTCIDNGNYGWEFGNEYNYAAMSIGMGDTVKDQERRKRIIHYLGWVKAIRRIQKDMGSPAAGIKLLSFGLAGMDVKFTDELQAAGGWELLDAMALHPGRGNFTADYPVSIPWQEWQLGAHGNYWNYYGSIRTAAELVKKYGRPDEPKDLFLTEVYAPCFPNSFWEDSLRHSAENAVLALALAKTVNAKAVMWYQLFDSPWYDKLGVNPKDREYYFGLVQRDLSFRPLLLAYVAAAEALDQATFVRWLQFPEHPQTRGLLFQTPRGPMTVLWDRTDGYVLSQNTPNFASPEAWIDPWKTKTTVEFAVSGKEVRVINCIGQETTLLPSAGKIRLTLDGAPRIVYGLTEEGGR